MTARAKELLARVTLLVLGTVAALLVGEVVLRLFDPLQLRVHGQEIILPRSVRFIFEDVHLRGVPMRVVHTKNQLGFRGEDRPADFGARLTLFTVGGSTTECFFLPDGEDWPTLLGKRLQSRFPQLWINNAGLDGHSTFGHARLLAQHILPLRPSVVLLLVGANDVGREDLSAMELQAEANRARRFTVDRLAASSYLLASAVSLRRSLGARCRGATHRDLDLLRQPSPPLDPSSTDPALGRQRPLLEAYHRRLERLVDLCLSSGTAVVLVTQPSLLGRGVDPETGVDLERVQVPAGLSGAAQWAVLESYNEVTRRVGHDKGALVVDLAARLPKSSRYFYDTLHFTAAGAAQVAEIIAVQIGPWLSERLPAKRAVGGPQP